MDGLTRNPLIASGVRCVELLVGYRPRRVAQSLERYKEMCFCELSHLRSLCETLPQLLCQNPEFDVLAASATYTRILSAWDECSDRSDVGGNREDGRSPTDEAAGFQELLYQCHEEYRLRQEDQDRLLADGSFVAALAVSAARTKGLRALSFSDYVYRHTFSGSRKELVRAANDMTDLREFMVMAKDWGDIEDSSAVPTLPPVRLLWEVPIALFENGVHLHELGVFALPVRSTFMLWTWQPAWDRLRDRLRAACRGLRRVDVGRVHGRFSQQSPLQAEGKEYTDKYFEALLSGDSLQRIDFDATFLNTGNSDLEYHIGPALVPAHYPNLRELTLEQVSFRQQELEALIGGLGSELRSITFLHVEVWDGTWERPLELLRRKIMRWGRHVNVEIACLHIEGLRRPDQDDDDGDSDDDWDVSEETLAYLSRYVSGEKGLSSPFVH
ncbi:hypothetical protein QBC39DRAFT_352801 [Podospora conica]|nr:hypothetical protein QBC39DRAFT_352801 [Schizothecium conicum]